MFATPSFKENNIEAMANAMTCSRDTGKTSTNDSNPRPTKFGTRRWWVGREQLDQEPLNKGVDPGKRVGRHGVEWSWKGREFLTRKDFGMLKVHMLIYPGFTKFAFAS